MSALSLQQAAEATLLRRLEVLEQLVFGRTPPSERSVEELGAKVEAIEKGVRRAEGGNQDIKDLGIQGVDADDCTSRDTQTVLRSSKCFTMTVTSAVTGVAADLAPPPLGRAE